MLLKKYFIFFIYYLSVSPYSIEMSSTSSGSNVNTVSKVDDRYKSKNGEQDKNAADVVYAETTEGQPLVIRCAARGARPQANVTWYYYYKDQENDDDEFGDGNRNDLNVRTTPVQTAKSSKHGAPVMLGTSLQHGGSTARSPSDYLISETRRMAGGAEIIGPVEIAQHTEYQVSNTQRTKLYHRSCLKYLYVFYHNRRYFFIINFFLFPFFILQADGTRDTHSQLSMSQLHRQQDGSIVRCDAFNYVGLSPSQPLSVNMTIRVKCK